MRSISCMGALLAMSAALCCAGATHAQTWNLQPSGVGRGLDDVAFLSASDVVAVGNKSGGSLVLIYSSNGGVAWANGTVGGVPPVVNMNAVAHDGSSTVVAVGAGGTIMRSTDKGANWLERVSPTNKALNAVGFVTASTVVAVGSNGDIVRSTDGGDTWTAPNSGTNRALNGLASSGNSLLAVGDKSGGDYTVIRSGDGGATWASTALPAGGATLDAVTYGDGGAWAVAVGRANSGNYTVLYSANSGNSWTPANFPAGGQHLNGVQFIDQTTVVAVGDNGALLRSEDSGANWASLTSGTGQNLKSFSSAQSQAYALAAGDNGAVVGSTDRGASWTAQTSGTAQNLIKVAAFNPAIVVGANGTVLLSTDQGAAGGGGGGGHATYFDDPSTRPQRLREYPRPGEEYVVVHYGGEWLLLAAVFACAWARLRPRLGEV